MLLINDYPTKANLILIKHLLFIFNLKNINQNSCKPKEKKPEHKKRPQFLFEEDVFVVVSFF